MSMLCSDVRTPPSTHFDSDNMKTPTLITLSRVRVGAIEVNPPRETMSHSTAKVTYITTTKYDKYQVSTSAVVARAARKRI